MASSQYGYPINDDWSTEELIKVVECLALVESAYDEGVDYQRFKQAYAQFKQIVTSIGEEKRISRSFEQESGCSLYRVVQMMKVLDKEQSAKARRIQIK